MTCKGICTRYQAMKPSGISRYASGQKRCQVCEIFVKMEGMWCLCCGYRLRSHPRSVKFKNKLRKAQGMKELEDDKPNRKEISVDADGKIILHSV